MKPDTAVAAEGTQASKLSIMYEDRGSLGRLAKNQERSSPSGQLAENHVMSSPPKSILAEILMRPRRSEFPGRSSTSGQLAINHVVPSTSGQLAMNHAVPSTSGQLAINHVMPSPSGQLKAVRARPRASSQLAVNHVVPSTSGQLAMNQVMPSTSGQLAINHAVPSTSGQLAINHVMPNPSGQLKTVRGRPRASGQLAVNHVVPSTSGKFSTAHVRPRASGQLAVNHVVPRTSAQLAINHMAPSTTRQFAINYVVPCTSGQLAINQAVPGTSGQFVTTLARPGTSSLWVGILAWPGTSGKLSEILGGPKTSGRSAENHLMPGTSSSLEPCEDLQTPKQKFKQDTMVGKLAVVRRLIRGLGATKHELRQGHYANFSCLLKQLSKDEFDFGTMNSIILKTLNPGSTSRQEIGEAYLGQVLAYSALVHTNHLDDQPENLETIATALIELSTKRSYLCAQCFECLCVLISKVPKEFGNEEFIQQLKAINTYTLDKLLYLMVLQNFFPESGTIKEVFDTNKLLSKSNAPKLADMIMKSCVNYSSDHKFYESFCTKIAKKIRFTTCFWSAVCEYVKSEVERKDGHPSPALMETFLTMCSNLLRQVIKQDLDPKYVDILIQEPVVKAILSHGRNYSKVTMMISESICTLLKNSDEESKMGFIKKILIPDSGSLSFDKISGTRTASNVIHMMGEDSIVEISDYLRQNVDTKGIPNKERLIALNLFCGLLSHNACYENTEWRLNGLKFLLRSGFFADTTFGVEFAGLIKNAFYSQISNRFPSLSAYTTVLKELVAFINEGFTKKLLRSKIDPELANTWKHAMKLEKNIGSHLANNPDEIIQSIYVLTLYMCLILFKEQEDTKINLQDIGSIFFKITKDAAQPKEGPTWIEVIMDLFLNLLSKPCSGHRHIIGCIFKYLTPHVNDAAFAELVSVLNSSWTHKVFEDGRQADEVSDASSEGSAEESEDDEDEDDTEEETLNPNEFLKESLQQKLRDVLGPGDEDMSDIDVENIGEEEGQRIDAALVEAFRTSAHLPANIINARENNTMHFQIKVLDLIEIIAKHGMNCSKLLTIIPALLNLYKTAVTKKQDQLISKLKNSIHKVVTSKVLAGDTTPAERAEVVTLLQHLLTQASFASGVNSELRPQLSAFSVFLIKSCASFSAEGGNKTNNDITNLVSNFLDEFFRSSKCHLPLSFFKSLSESLWPGISKFLKKIAEYSASDDIKIHKRIDALRLLKNYFNNGRYFVTMTPDLESNIKRCGNIILRFDSSNSETLQSKYYIALWNLIMVFLKSKASSCVKWTKWKNMVQNTVYPARQPVIKKKEMKRFKKMCSMLEIPEDMFTQTSQPQGMPTRRSEMKRKTGEQTSNVEGDENNENVGASDVKNAPLNSGAKRRKVNPNKLKKQSKILRMEAMNVGLESNVFSRAHLPMDED